MATASDPILRAATYARYEVCDAAATGVDVGSDGAHIGVVTVWSSVMVWRDVRKSVWGICGLQAGADCSVGGGDVSMESVCVYACT